MTIMVTIYDDLTAASAEIDRTMTENKPARLKVTVLGGIFLIQGLG
jgi:hypothetical protein